MLNQQTSEESILHQINTTTLVLDNKIYKKCGAVVSGSGNKLVFKNAKTKVIVNLVRQKSSYHFKDSNNNEYIVASHKVYKYSNAYKGKSITTSFDKPLNLRKTTNLLIEGDNLQALKLLLKTHKDSIDVICIDPPYNTGNVNMKYNDCFAQSQEDDNTSWLAFMSSRLSVFPSMIKSDHYSILGTTKRSSTQKHQYSIPA